jgi:16S rRNA (guanine1207-N2)-methyltransferase
VATVTGPSARDRAGGTSAGGEHYFSPAPGTASRPAAVRLTLPDLTVDLATDAGVFSPSRVDPGTKLLLTELPEPSTWPDGVVVDVGAGYGPIAVTLALRAPGREVWAVEVNERARELCRTNAAAVGVTGRVRVIAPEEVPPDLQVGMVVSNPPIRIGKAALHELISGWLARLGPRSDAWLVVQKHLGADSLARWLTEQGHDVERTRSRQGYRILRVH